MTSADDSLPSPPSYSPWVFFYCLFALVWTLFLLYAGGFTTSIRAGMAFLDWPLSNGSLNPEGWWREQDQLAEHSHRLLGMKVGFLTLLLMSFLLWKEKRSWVRKLGVVAFIAVVVQGVLGGLRVLLDELNLTHLEHNLYAQTFAVIHACLAQFFLCLLVAITMAVSRPWMQISRGWAMQDPGRAVRIAGLVACASIVLQLILGAIMRHTYAGLAIPTFPLTPEGGLIPVSWDFRVGIHFAHRAGAVVATAAIGWFLWMIWRSPAARSFLGPWSFLLGGLLLLQIYLGALVIWTIRNSHAATIHMLTGAFLLAVCWAMAFACFRSRLARREFPPRRLAEASSANPAETWVPMPAHPQ